MIQWEQFYEKIPPYKDISYFLSSLGNNFNIELLQLLQKCGDCLYKKDFDNSLLLSDQVLDFTWEILNSGKWNDVDMCYLKVYSLSSLFHAISVMYLPNGKQNTQKICKVCDMGILMGAPIFDNILNKMLQFVTPFLPKIPLYNEKLLNDTLENVTAAESCDVARRVDSLNCPSLMLFEKYMKNETPVVLKNSVTHWPAIKKWSLEYINKIAGHRTVPVEVGSKYTDVGWSQKLMTINQFINNYVIKCNDNKGYLAQHTLFDQIKELRDDIDIPDYCCIPTSSDDDPQVDINCWFGPKGTVSPCHHDPKHNLLVQVKGRKYIRLYPSHTSQYLYPRDNLLTNTSQVDVENPDHEQFPHFAAMDAKFCRQLILEPGDVLYIPPKHWHFVRSLDVSFSVSFWW